MLQRCIAALADFVTRARTHVARSGYTKEMLYAPEAEAPTRLSQQLAQLAKGSALVDGRSEVNGDDYTLVKRVAFDCIPTLRRKVIVALIRGEDLAAITPAATVTYCVQDLQALDVLVERKLSVLSSELLGVANVTGEFTRTPPVSIQ
jgi:hypothetical protein